MADRDEAFAAQGAARKIIELLAALGIGVAGSVWTPFETPSTLVMRLLLIGSSAGAVVAVWLRLGIIVRPLSPPVLKRRLTQTLLISTSTLFLSGVGLIAMIVRYTARYDTIENRVIGFVLTPTGRTTMEANPHYTSSDLLMHFTGEPTRAWEPWSVGSVHVALVVCYLLVVMCVVSVLECFGRRVLPAKTSRTSN